MDRSRRPASASTVATVWSIGTSVSIGHNIPHRHIPVIKGDVNYVNNHITDTNDDYAFPSKYIQETLEQLQQMPIDSIDHEDALEFLYDLFYMHSSINQDDSRIARLLINGDYCSIAYRCLIDFVASGIFSQTNIRRSTQFILYTLWNFTGMSVEFRVHLSGDSHQKFVQFLIVDFLQYLTSMKNEQRQLQNITDNLMQATVSIIHNLTLTGKHLSVQEPFAILEQLLLNRDPRKSNERLRITLLLCLIHLDAKRVDDNVNHHCVILYQLTFKLLFRLLHKTVQQEILMMTTGLSAWLLAFAINKLSNEIILVDDDRLCSFIVLFKRGMREEKIEAGIALHRCMKQSIHAKQIIENDAICRQMFEQYRVYLDEELHQRGF